MQRGFDHDINLSCGSHEIMLCSIGFAKDQRKLEEIIGELEKQGVKP
jgi:hypothetical protein